MKHAFLENNLLFNSAMHSSLGASIAYSHSEKGVGKPHEFTSSQNAVCSIMFFPLVGRLCSRGFYFTFWLSKWDFSRLFYTERSWRGYSFSVVLAELPRAKRAQRSTMGKKMKKTTHPRKFGNQYTDRPPARPPERLSVRTTGQPMFIAILGAQEGWYCTHIAHQCCDQLTAVKTGYPLTSLTWPYRRLRCRPIEVEYLFEVIRWQVTSFQMIADSSLIFY